MVSKKVLSISYSGNYIATYHYVHQLKLTSNTLAHKQCHRAISRPEIVASQNANLFTKYVSYQMTQICVWKIHVVFRIIRWNKAFRRPDWTDGRKSERSVILLLRDSGTLHSNDSRINSLIPLRINLIHPFFHLRIKLSIRISSLIRIRSHVVERWPVGSTINGLKSGGLGCRISSIKKFHHISVTFLITNLAAGIWGRGCG